MKDISRPRIYAHKELLIINELNMMANEGFALELITKKAVELIRDVFSFNNCSILLLNKSKDTLIFKAVSLDKKFIKRLEKEFGQAGGKDLFNLLRTRVDLKKAAVFRKTIETKQPQVVERSESIQDYITDKKIKSNMEKVYRALQDKNIVRFPMVTGKEVYGILSATKSEKFNQDDMDCLSDLSLQLALILRKHISEEKIISSELKYRSLFANAGDPILMLNSSGNIIEFNNKACDVYEYSFQEMLGMDVRELDVKLTPEEMNVKIKEVLKYGYIVFETIHKKNNSGTIDMLVTGTSIKAEEGQIIQLINKDISELKKLAKYKEKEKQLDLYVGAIDLSAIPMVLWNLDKIIFANKKMTSLTGYTNEELKNMSFRDLVRKKDHGYFDTLCEFLFANDIGVSSAAEISISNERGEEKKVIVNQVKTDMGNGDPIFSTTLIDKNYTSKKLEKINIMLETIKTDIEGINCGTTQL